MKCPFRTIKKEKYMTNEAMEIPNNVVIRNLTLIQQSEEFADCLGNECMAYRKHRRTEMCQKFPMGYYKDILD